MNRDQRTRKAIKRGEYCRLNVIAGFGQIDTAETSKDPMARTDGFKCHKGTVVGEFFFPRKDNTYVYKKFFLINYQGDFVVMWVYNLRVHDYRKYTLFRSGEIYRGEVKNGIETATAVNLPFFTKKEWMRVALTLLDYSARHKDELKDEGHADMSHKKLRSVVPGLRTPSPVWDTNVARFSAMRQHQSNMDWNVASVSEAVTYDDSYFLRHSRLETPHGAKPDPNTIRLSGNRERGCHWNNGKDLS